MKLLETKAYEEKRSRFLAYKYEVEDEEDFDQCFDRLAKEHEKARHILRAACFVNKFGAVVVTSSEDREPTSAMKKLAQLLERKKAVGTAIFVVRYFGGTKLGASHLDRIYFALGSGFLS